MKLGTFHSRFHVIIISNNWLLCNLYFIADLLGKVDFDSDMGHLGRP